MAQSAAAPLFTFDKKTLSVILPLYGFAAAALPVWLLLAPRDYLSTYMKIGVVIALALGMFFVNPPVRMPFITEFGAGGGPIISGPVWPYVCITIACGAISGFHALIGSGTTPKLVERERQIPMIGYGAMLTEAFVAVMALLAATTLVPSDYFAINSTPEAFRRLNMEVVDLCDPRPSKSSSLDKTTAVRKVLNLQPGQRMQVVKHEGRIEFIPERDLIELRGFLRGINTGFKREGDRV